MLFDIHTHISQFNNDELVPMRQRWNSNNVGFVLSAGTNVNDSYESIKLAKKYSDRVVCLIDGTIIFDEKSSNINEAYLKKIYT